MKPFSYLIVLSALFASVTAWSEQTSECSQIENKNERLLCFDREFPNTAPPNKPSETTQTSSDRISNTPVSKAAAPASSQPENQAEPRGNNGLSVAGLLDWKETQSFESEISAIRSGGQQRMVFRLDNGQIWMQSSPRALPFSVGNKVVIKSGRVGGFIMRSESGTSTRVKRIE